MPRLRSALGLRVARGEISIAVSMATVLAAIAAIVALACIAPPSPSDTVQTTLMYRLVTSL